MTTIQQVAQKIQTILRRASKNGDKGHSHPVGLILVLSGRLRCVEGAVHVAAHQSGVSQIRSGFIDVLPERCRGPDD